jgi:hypothetical protein
MATTPSIRVVKTFMFKGGLRQWSNRYHFNGGTPADATHWHTLMDNVTTAEKACLQTGDTIVEALGYAAGSDVPVATKTYSVAGTFSPGANDHASPGECSALVRWSTGARSVKNHPIYLFSYFHHVLYDSTFTSADKLPSDLKSAYGTYAAAWITGFSDGSITAVRASPNGAVATGYIVEEYITHRDFPPSSSV